MPKILVSGEIWKEGNMYTAYCRELDVASCGKTIDEAWKNLKEVLEIFLEETSKKGTLEDLLLEAGFVTREEEIRKEERFLGEIELAVKI